VPYLSDSPGQLETAVRQAAAAGAAHVSPIVLHLRPGAREWFLGWLREAHPALVPRYAELYGRGAYARQEYQSRISAEVRELAERYGVGRGNLLAQRVGRGDDRSVRGSSGARGGRSAGRGGGARDGGPTTPDDGAAGGREQLALF
jgi:DNA repair photolyase